MFDRRNTIKKIEQMYSDIFGFDVEEYWRNEGNNKRMQKYHNFAKGLKEANIFIKWLMFGYFIFLATSTISHLSNGIVEPIPIIDILQKYLCIYFCGFIITCWFIKLGVINHDNRDEFLKKIIIAMPLIYLAIINVVLLNNLLGILLIVFAFLGIIYVNSSIIERLDTIYEYATKDVSEEGVKMEVSEVIVNKNKRKKERKRK